jgi:4-amino-4-deoxy-L-arabinose transferase-like glycosyltransferase
VINGRWRHHWVPLGIWTLSCALFYASFLLGVEFFSGGDLNGQFYAFGLFQGREMVQGRLPIWSPGSYAGIPFAADTQAAVFYPLRWLTILFSLPWQFPYYALELEVIVHVWLAGVFTYALVYAITRERWSGLLAAIAFGLGGFLASYPLSQLAILETITWLPLVLLLLRTAVDRDRPVRWLVGAGLVLALSGLAGHPQTFMHASYTAAAYYMYLSMRARWRWKWWVGLGVVVLVISIGSTTMVWLPAARYVAATVRGNVSYEFVSTGLPLLNTIHLLVPSTLAELSPSYIGIGAFILAVLAWLGRKHAGPRNEILFWGTLALIAAWLSLGDAGVLFEAAHRLLPGFSLFRQQERLMGIFSFSAALVAAQGLALWLRTDFRVRQKLLRRLPFVMVGGLLLAALVLTLATPIASDDWSGIWWRQLGFTLLALALLWYGRRRRWSVLIIIPLLAVDLYQPSLIGIERAPGSPSVIWSEPGWVPFLKTGTISRFDSSHVAFANLGEIFDIEDINGISPLKLQTTADFESLPLRRRWQLLNVTHVLSDDPPTDVPLTETAAAAQGYRLYRFDDALPRAWLSYQTETAPNAAVALERLRAPEFDPSSSVILHTAVPEIEQVRPPTNPPEVEVRRLRSNALAIDVVTETPGILVISEWAYPGWRATLDGESTPLHPADYGLQAIWLPAGRHEVEMRFMPTDVVMGILISIATILAAAVVAWRWRPAVVIATEQRRPLVAVPTSSTAKPSLASRTWRWLVLLLVLLGVGLRLVNMSGQELRSDEAFSYLFAHGPIEDIVPALIEQGDPHSPFHYLLLHGWIKLAGDSEFSMRYLSLIPGVLSLPLLYQMGRQLGDRKMGLLIALLSAISQSLVWIGQDVRNQYTLVILFSVLATVLLARVTRSHKSSPGRPFPAVGLWLAYAVASALTVYSHYFGVFALLGHGLFLLVLPERRRQLLPWMGCAVLAALLFLPWLLTIYPQLVAAGQLNDPGNPELAHYLAAVGTEISGGPALDGWFRRWFFCWSAAFAIIGVRHLLRRRPGWAALLITWLAGSTLLIFLVQFRRATFNPFYITVAAPAWWVLVVAGLATLWRHKLRRLRLLAILGATSFIVISFLSLSNYYFDSTFQRSNGYRGIATHIKEKLEAKDAFVANFPDPSLVYYLKDVAIPYQMQPSAPDVTPQDTEQALRQLSDEYDRLWFVPAHSSVWDPEDVAFQWLESHSVLEQEARYLNLDLLAYRPLHAAHQVMTPINLSLPGRLILEEVLVTVNGVPADLTRSPLVIPAGASVQVTLLWEALAEIPVDDTVFVHLLDTRGAPLITQHDGVPAFGLRPTSTWQPGDRILDRHQIDVPELVGSEKALLTVGMYDPKTLDRRVFDDGRDAILIATVAIEQ